MGRGLQLRPAAALEVDLELRDGVGFRLGHHRVDEPVDRLARAQLGVDDLRRHGIHAFHDALADHVQRGGDQLVERGEEVARRRRRHPGPRRDRPVGRPRDALLGDDLDRGVEQGGPARPAAGPMGGWPDRHDPIVPRVWTFVQTCWHAWTRAGPAASTTGGTRGAPLRPPARRRHVSHDARARLPQGHRGQRLGPGARPPALRGDPEQLLLRPDARRGRLHRRLRRQARAGRGPRRRLAGAVDRVRHAREHLPRAARRARDRPHAPALRLGPRGAAPPDPGPHRRAGPLPRPRGRDHRLRPVGHRLPREERAEEDHERRQRVHPRQPRHRGRGHRPGARRVQHGPAREGVHRLPAGADDRVRQGLHDPRADPRDRLRQAAQGREAHRRTDHQVGSRRACSGCRPPPQRGRSGEDEIEAAADLIVSDFDEEAIDSFLIEMKHEGITLESIELTHEDMLAFEDRWAYNETGDDEEYGQTVGHAEKEDRKNKKHSKHEEPRGA